MRESPVERSQGVGLEFPSLIRLPTIHEEPGEERVDVREGVEEYRVVRVLDAVVRGRRPGAGKLVVNARSHPQAHLPPFAVVALQHR